MITFFGPAGAGKSMQGQILAARHGWRWLSTGVLLRDSTDPEVIAKVKSGELVDDDTVKHVLSQALDSAADIDHVILDGFPRKLQQAEWLLDEQAPHGREIKIVIVLEVPRDEIIRRLQVRGRTDDTPEAIQRRLTIYRQEIYPILTYLTERGVHIAHIDGAGTVGQVHDRIEAELVASGLTPNPLQSASAPADQYTASA